MKQQVRAKGVVKSLRGFMKRHGQRGMEVARYEWTHFARIWQTDRRYRWRPRRLGWKALLKRVYREDDLARVNWSVIMSRVPLDRPVQVEYPGHREPFEREYLQEVLKPQGNYAVDRKVEVTKDNGEKATELVRDFFRLLVCSTHGRGNT